MNEIDELSKSPRNGLSREIRRPAGVGLSEVNQPLVVKSAQDTLTVMTENIKATVCTVAKETEGRCLTLEWTDKFSIAVGDVVIRGSKKAVYRQED